jgi:hypothetical protein
MMNFLKVLLNIILPFMPCAPYDRSRDSSVVILNAFRLGVRGSISKKLFSTAQRPDRFWGPPSFPSSGYRGLIPLE